GATPNAGDAAHARDTRRDPIRRLRAGVGARAAVLDIGGERSAESTALPVAGVAGEIAGPPGAGRPPVRHATAGLGARAAVVRVRRGVPARVAAPFEGTSALEGTPGIDASGGAVERGHARDVAAPAMVGRAGHVEAGALAVCEPGRACLRARAEGTHCA